MDGSYNKDDGDDDCGKKPQGKAPIPYEQVLRRKRERERLPDKLFKHLNSGSLDGIIWWVGTSNWAIDTKIAQKQFLDIHLQGIKMSSFIRSLNRW
jgi:hypothetical protein